MTSRYPMRFLALLSGCVLLTGCGTGSKPAVSNSDAAAGGGRGALQVTIAWPPKSSNMTRLIPAAAQSIDIRIFQQGNEIAHSVAPRPGDTFPNPTIVLIKVPAGDLTETVAAFPSKDGTGVAQASATVRVTVVKDATQENTVEMNSTIATLQVSSSATTLATGKTATLTVTALDAANPPNIVLIDPSQLAYTSADGAALTIAAAGATATVTGVTAGSHKVNVTEKESGKTGSVTLTVAGVAPPPAADPHILVADTVNHRVIGVDDITGKNFTVLGANFYGPQDTAFDSAARIYVADYPIQLDRFDNILGKSPVAYKPASPASFIYIDKSGHIFYRDDDLKINRIDDISGAGHVSFGGIGTGIFQAPQGIDTDSQNRIYVADSIKNRVYRFDDMTGANQKFFGSDGTLHLDLGGLSGGTGHDLAVDLGNRVYIADFNNKRIVRIDPAAFDDPLTANLAAFNVPANGSGNVFKPLAVAVDSGTTPRIYFTGVYQDTTGKTTDAAIFRMDDMKGANLTRFGTFGSGVGQFSYPVSISVR